MVRTAVSIQDVADRAGVSIATVSRVLNNPGMVAAETAERVRGVVSEMGYIPNVSAQSLVTRSSRLLAMALPDIHGEFYSALLSGADAEAKKQGYHLLVSSGQGKAMEHDLGLGPLLGLVDGVAAMITEPNAALVKRISTAGVPMVVLDAAPAGSNLDTIEIDNEAGARAATEHLLTLVPPERCFFIGGPKDNFDTMERAEAFAAAVIGEARRRGSAANAGMGASVAYGQYSFEWGKTRAEQMIADGTLSVRGAAMGVLAGNDEIAYGVLHAAREAGVEVPGRLCVVGFDDTRLASLVRPTLSTVRVPLAEVGATAVQLLVRRIKDAEASPMHVRLTPTLVVRQTTRG
jgi:LacI family transcriptional regulator